ncbi:hypothetical protein GBA52_003485 [Prunus armeniaca]|nr:hypothetical protein GBA52_003485 [Prunus armeniaca]
MYWSIRATTNEVRGAVPVGPSSLTARAKPDFVGGSPLQFWSKGYSPEEETLNVQSLANVNGNIKDTALLFRVLCVYTVSSSPFLCNSVNEF